MTTVKLIGGRSNPQLANGISKYLEVPLTNCVIDSFANGETRIEINENIRGCHVFIIETGATTVSGAIGGNRDQKFGSINDFLVETLLLIDACKRADAYKVAVILACFPYARSDKKDRPRVPIGASMVTNVLLAAGCDRIITMDLHSGQIQGFANQIPFDNLYGINLHLTNLRKFFGKINLDVNSLFVLVSLDVGGAKRVKEYAKRLNMSHAIMDKQRDYSKPGTIMKSQLIGDVKGKYAICIDDMADTCGTIIAGVKDLESHGCIGAYILITHGIFSGPAFDRLNSCDFIKNVICINTIDQTSNTTLSEKLLVIDASELFGKVIQRVANGGSVSELFEDH